MFCRRFQQKPLAAAVLRNQPDAGLDGLARRFKRSLLAKHLDLAACKTVRAEDGAHHLGAPGADQAGNAEHLALMQIE